MKIGGIMRKAISAAMLALCLAAPSTAFADVNCTFTISSLWITPDGWINAGFNGYGYGKGWWLCPVSASITVNDGYSSKTVSSDNCKAIYSQLLTAKASAHPIHFQFHGPADCSSAALPADGSVPSPYFANIGIIE
jgi:hypothetical protein